LRQPCQLSIAALYLVALLVTLASNACLRSSDIAASDPGTRSLTSRRVLSAAAAHEKVVSACGEVIWRAITAVGDAAASKLVTAGSFSPCRRTQQTLGVDLRLTRHGPDGRRAQDGTAAARKNHIRAESLAGKADQPGSNAMDGRGRADNASGLPSSAHARSAGAAVSLFRSTRTVACHPRPTSGVHDLGVVTEVHPVGCR
jgi:hypothetical protein